MKTGILFCLTVPLVILGCTSQPRAPMEGAWHVVSWGRMAGDSLVWEFPGTYTGSEVKIWSKNHFLFVGRYKRDTTFIDNCGGGTYKLEGNRYEEHLLYFPDQSAVGTTVRLLLEIKNDTLTQTWPVDENWKIAKSNYNVQKLTRLE